MNSAILVVALLFALVLAATLYLTRRNNTKLEGILEESVKSELLAVCFAASEIVYDHIELFKAINTEKDIDRYREEFDTMMARLQSLRRSVGANDNVNVKYIYTLKKIDDKYFFIFDTDAEALKGHDDGDPDGGIVTEYTDIAKIHLDAFAGQSSAGIMNAKDEWGSYNTGAVPLHDPRTGGVIGVLGVDIDDAFIERSRRTAAATMTLLSIVMALSMGALLTVLILLIRRNAAMQADLYRIANRDAITELPNRRYLFNYLKEKSGLFSTESMSFAVFFIDLDNFKRVNDSAGHDMGDELLRKISEFLNRSQQNFVACVRNSGNSGEQPLDAITARIGGDEFLQITPDVTNETEAADFARNLLKSFQTQSALETFIRDFGVGLSIGVALFPSMSRDYNDLMMLADIAMYHAKFSGKNNFAFYRPEMGDNVDNQSLSIRSVKKGRKARAFSPAL
ncbi:MAG: GGDEF domain-containing protein [Candidatus Accumulibacter sp.]|nr:GGDEF domain-containing protein [Accumulibacter sp.]